MPYDTDVPEVEKARIKRLYASPMRRCMLTATPIARELGVDINVRADIHEHGGCFEGSAEGEVVGREIH